MERFAHRESVLLGYSPQRSFEKSSRDWDTNPEMDFSDVFGGPPRRFSIQESRVRYSFSEGAADFEAEDEDAAAVLSRSPWSVADEKPVFGEENGSRRTHQGDDFFDDIFKCDENKSFHSPRRRNGRDFFGSSPGSRVEPFSTSVPAQFSLPAKVTKTTDFPAFDSTTKRSLFHNRDGISNGTMNGHTSGHLYRKSPLSQEVSNAIQETGETKSNEKNMGAKLEKSEKKEVSLSTGQFHFSIYKWAGNGVPLLMSLGEGGKSRFKDRFRTDRSASSNGRIESDIKGSHLPTFNNEPVISSDTESISLNESSRNHHDSSEEKNAESGSDIEKVHHNIPEPKPSVSEGNDIPQVETNKKGTSMNKGQTPKTEQKPLHELLNDNNQEQGNVAVGKDNKVKNTNKVSDAANVSASKKNDAKRRTNGHSPDTPKDSFRKSDANSGDAFGGSRVKGKVGEFVKIFNHESSEKNKTDFRNQSTRWKQMNTHVKENSVTNMVKTVEEVQALNKTKTPESSSRENDNFNKNKVRRESHSKISFRKTSGLSTNEKNGPLFSESLPNNYGTKAEDRDESPQGYFLVEELPNVEEKISENSEEAEHFQASSTKIQQWSSGRKGNIRSLLSTLQFVLWPESGWKTVPLVDLIEASAVKRAYQRALLCLHPDKLQQKGAASHQKYIAQQVFDILQEAWDLYNSLGAI